MRAGLLEFQISDARRMNIQSVIEIFVFIEFGIENFIVSCNNRGVQGLG